MKGKAFILSFSLLALGFGLNAQQASLAGNAVDSLAHKPLSGVHIRLTLQLPGVEAVVYGAISDPFGHFSFASATPGTYTLTADRSGYFYASAPTIALKGGERVADFRLEMKAQAVISGRVLDEFGDPVAGVQVTAQPLNDPAGKRGNPAFGNTDDHGEFRLRATPGKYRLKADVQNLGFDGVPEARADKDANALYVPTYLPSVTNSERATTLEALPGREISGNNIRLVRQRAFSIRGVVKGIPDPSTLAFVFANPSSGNAGSVQAPTDPDGTFALGGLQPGEYELTAAGFSENPQMLSRPTELRIDDSDLANIELTLLAGEELTGTVALPPGLQKPTVLLSPHGFKGPEPPRPSGGDVGKDGVFHIRNVFPGQYQVRVEPLVGNAYVKELRLDDEVVNEILDLPNGPRGSTLKVTISANGGEISGAIQDSKGDPIANTPASVFLVSDLKTVHARGSVTRDGTYAIHGVRPGKYRLLVMEDLPPVSSDSDSFEQIAAKAPEIEIAEGIRMTRDLRLPKKEDANAKQ